LNRKTEKNSLTQHENARKGTKKGEGEVEEEEEIQARNVVSSLVVHCSMKMRRVDALHLQKQSMKRYGSSLTIHSPVKKIYLLMQMLTL